MHKVTTYAIQAERNPDRVELEFDTVEGKIGFEFGTADEAGVLAKLLNDAAELLREQE
jgi:hypothetical protein